MRVVKFCKDCRYWDSNKRDNPELDRCRHPKFFQVEVVRGHPTPGFAGICRQYEHLCGDKAKYFEPALAIEPPVQPPAQPPKPWYVCIGRAIADRAVRLLRGTLG